MKGENKIMWLFYEYGNYIPMGSDGEWKLPSDVKSMKKLREMATNFLGHRPGRVYCMRAWTQEMCELTPDNFVAYIMRHGQLLAWSPGCAPQGK